MAETKGEGQPLGSGTPGRDSNGASHGDRNSLIREGHLWSSGSARPQSGDLVPTHKHIQVGMLKPS